MTMSFVLHDANESSESYEPLINTGRKETGAANAPVHILREKLRIPAFAAAVERPRLTELLHKSETQFSATLISGRSGTGKSALAASFVDSRKGVAWYSLEPPDIDWGSFSFYFASAVQGATKKPGRKKKPASNGSATVENISGFLGELFLNSHSAPSMIVLDDIHHIFDAEWFGDFFNLLIASIPTTTHLLLLCRSRPPSPLWRLRSKQLLNVIDEKLLAFNQTETEELFDRRGFSPKDAIDAHRSSYGRISKLLEIANARNSDL